MEKNLIRLYDGMAYGVSVSNYGITNGYLDYRSLGKIVGDCILNNTVRAETMDDWEIIAGEFDEMVFQDYIITERGYEFLQEYTDELVFYNEKLEMYIWGITHFGTSWDYVLTNIKLINETERKWYGFEMNKRDSIKFREYLCDHCIHFEPSECYDIVHFECKMAETELNHATKWIQRNLLIL